MQGTSESGVNSKLIDETINFRPSPNFKYMKKYRKSKFEEDQYNNEEERKNKINTTVQPPLPPNSPPPDSPITLKQEIEDDGYERPLEGYSPCAEDASADAEDAGAPPPAAPDASADASADADAGAVTPPKKFTMCKDWVRGTCARGAACIHVHELDKSQLKGVYRFCRDFENSRCKRPVCNFVHATTFEKEHFFRSAYLPPHAFYHLQNSVAPPSAAAAAGAVVAPVPAPEVAGPTEMPAMFGNPPPPALVSGAAVPVCGAAVPVCGASGVAGAAGGALEPRLKFAGALTAAHAALGAPAVSLKREWRDQDDYSSSPRDPEPEPPTKKCKNCEFSTIRLQHSKAQVASALRGSQELDEKLEVLSKKSDRLQAVLKTLLKPRRVLEHMNNNFLGGLRLGVLGDDANKDALLAQMKVLLTKILLGSEAEARDRDLAT